MRILQRQIRKLILESIAESVSGESDKDINIKIHNAALELLRDNPDFEYDDCYDEAAEQLGYKNWNEQGKKEYGQKADTHYQVQKARQPDIEEKLRQRLKSNPYYQRRMAREVHPRESLDRGKIRQMILDSINESRYHQPRGKHQSEREAYDPDSGGDPSMSAVYGDPNEKLRGATIEYPGGKKAFLQSMIDTYRRVGMDEEADKAQAELDAMTDDVFKSTLE